MQIQRLVRLTYPSASEKFSQQLCLRTFIDGVKDTYIQCTTIGAS